VVNPRDRLLDVAGSLMHERGYEAVGVAELCAEAGVKKGSFYHFFPSKRALALEALDRAWNATRTSLFDETFGDSDLDALDAIDLYGRRLAARHHRGAQATGTVSGCRFGNFAVELSSRDELIRVRIAEVFDEMAAIVADVLRRDMELGRLRADLDADAVATSVITHMEGLMVMAKANRDPDLLVGLGPLARCLVS
jgi:TetR/AcrR family transcriptional regulator, transcriptional repressor for nem operon